MTICYDPTEEKWVSTEDTAFEVDMTPEDGCPTEEFETEDDFWDWWFNETGEL